MEEELSMMRESKVWNLVDPPPNKSILGNQWDYSIKRDEFVRVARFKARLVA